MKKAPKGSAAAERPFAVAVEAMRAEFRVFGEALHGFRSDVDRRFAEVDGRLDRIDGRLDRIDGRLDGIDGRLDKVEGRLDRVEGEVGLLKDAVLEHTREIQRHGRRIDELEITLRKKVDREEAG